MAIPDTTQVLSIELKMNGNVKNLRPKQRWQSENGDGDVRAQSIDARRVRRRVPSYQSSHQPNIEQSWVAVDGEMLPVK